MALDRQLPISGCDLIRLIVVDDDDLVRSGLARSSASNPTSRSWGRATTGSTCPRWSRDSARRRTHRRADAPHRRHHRYRATHRGSNGPAVVVITTFESDDSVRDALLAGARGFVLKRARPEELLTAIRTVARTDSLVFPDAIRRVATRRTTVSEPGRSQLTAREREVLDVRRPRPDQRRDRRVACGLP